MIPIVETDGKKEYALLEQLAARSGETDRRVTAAVQEIIDNVRSGGDKAVIEYTRKFDGTDTDLAPIDRGRLAEIAERCDKKVYTALENAAHIFLSVLCWRLWALLFSGWQQPP